MIAYDVYLDGVLFDLVWFTGYTVDEVRRSLIDHDGYDGDIVVQVGR